LAVAQDYPPLYVVRPDGSTLYSYRDVVYRCARFACLAQHGFALHTASLTCRTRLLFHACSFKKASAADLVLTVVCSEQDLAQQKVALAMAMLNPAMTGRQYHVSYDLVRLPAGRMSGRRGRYLLADDLYEELKSVIRTTMREKYASKGEAITDEFFDSVTHEARCATRSADRECDSDPLAYLVFARFLLLR